MRLVLKYTVSDDCTYSYTQVTPVEYESAEALLVELMDAAKAALLEGRNFEFCGEQFDPDLFYSRVSDEWASDNRRFNLVKAHGQHYLPVEPSVLTLDEWFADSLQQTPAKSA